MEKVVLDDKKFRKYITHDEIQRAVQKCAEKMNYAATNTVKPLIVGVLNGSFMFLSDLMKNLTFNCELTFVRIASYYGTQSTGECLEILGLNTDIDGRDIILVEDIVDTGSTIANLYKMLTTNHKPKSIKIATLLLKPDVYKGEHKLDYVAIEIPNEFIVGYGLDYNGLGRNLKDIYKIEK